MCIHFVELQMGKGSAIAVWECTCQFTLLAIPLRGSSTCGGIEIQAPVRSITAGLSLASRCKNLKEFNSEPSLDGSFSVLHVES
ncbi:MAG: hypothetical protein TQ35_0010170 [Candidatus Aramenus sulfurataquae]|uniref:Uncharacterized protein n=2 Tax=Candidatus Aramenus sulfurataquae TaxID=1326980 RepID=A0AAE3K2G8_9CREN|nr:hypothetical protein [Candidatus Aramenus sulfurataquae]